MGHCGGIYVPTESNGGVPINQQDQTTPMVILPLHQDLNAFTLASSTVIDSSTLTLVAGHSIVVGNLLIIREGTRYYRGHVLVVATNVITLDTPLDYVYSTSANCWRANSNLNVDGSTTPVVAHIKPPLEGAYDIYNINLIFSGNVEMDPSLFGGIASLTKGCVLRHTNGIHYNITNIKNNASLIMFAVSHTFKSKVAGGEYWFITKHSIINSGVATRLDGTTADSIELIIQDDLSGDAALSLFTGVATGHAVTD